MDEDTSDDEGVTDDQQAKKKSKKEKIGFRDRKVWLCQILVEIIVIKRIRLIYLSFFHRDHITSHEIYF